MSGKRPRKSKKNDPDFVYDSENSDSDDDTRPRRARAVKPRVAAAAAAAAVETNDFAAESGSDIAQDGNSDVEEDAEITDEELGEDSDEENEGEDEALDAPLSTSAMKKVNKGVRSTLALKTQRDYSNPVVVFKRWLEAGGFRDTKQSTLLTYDTLHKLPRQRLVNLFFRFFEWWIVKGRPGDKFKGGRQVEAGEYGRSAAVKLHSSLQLEFDDLCSLAGHPTAKLATLSPYSGLYKQYCSKKRDRALRTAAADGTNKATILYMSFGRDSYIRGCTLRLASSDPNDTCVHSLITAQVALVARGDDVRGFKLMDLATRMLTCVGPSAAIAFVMLQPPAAGKTLESRPAYKGMLRSKLPELCPVGALFRWLSVRFKIKAEPIPRPKSRKFKQFYLWPGQAGKEMSPSNHGAIMNKLFEELAVQTAKVTHELRIFAAQVMYEMGVSLEVIQRIGHWLLDSFGTAYIVPGFTAEALLALAFWPGAAQKDFTGYWAERFHVAILALLIYLLFPGIKALEEEAAALIAAGKPDAELNNLVLVLRMGGVVVVQDALELAERFPDNPVHAMLLQEPAFRKLLQEYKEFKSLGGFEPQRPLSVKELVTQQVQRLEQRINNAVSFGAASLNWQGFDDLQREAQLDEQQQQEHPLSADEVMETLQKIAAGELKPSDEVVARLRQQKGLMTDGQQPMQQPQPAVHVDANATAHQAAEAAQHNSTAAAAAAAAARLPATAAVDPNSTDSPSAAAPGPEPAAAEAPVSSSFEAERAASPDVHLSFEVQEPPEQLITPSGKKYTREQLEANSDTFYVGKQVSQQQQPTAAVGQQQLIQRHVQQQPVLLQLIQLQQKQMEQQQQLLCQVSKQQQDIARLMQLVQRSASVPVQQPHDLQPEPQEPEQHDHAAEMQQKLLHLLQQAMPALQQQQQLQQQQRQQQNLQQQQQNLQQLLQHKSHILQQMGAVDPLASIAQPWITSQPNLNAVLGAANNAALNPGASSSNNIAAGIMAVLSNRDERLLERIKLEMTAAVMPLLCGQGSAAAGTGDGTAAAAAAASGSNAVNTAAAAAAAAAATATAPVLVTHIAMPGAHPTVVQQPSSSSGKAKAKPSKEKIGFPGMSSFSNVTDLVEWYYVHPLQDTGKTPQQLEAAGKEDDYEWRGGSRHRYQRWQEYEIMLRAVEAERDRLTDEERSRAHNAHRVARSGAVQAARNLDDKRQQLRLSLCEYREFLNRKGKGWVKGKQREADMQQEAAAAEHAA